jgi:hypothetical protein
VQPKHSTSVNWVHIYINSALGDELRALANMLDSLVRVSRRDDERHFVLVTRLHADALNTYSFEVFRTQSSKHDLQITIGCTPQAEYKK